MATNISCLVRACTGRGEQIASSGPSIQPTWLAAITSGPVVGTRSAPWISIVVPPAQQRLGDRTAGA